MHGVARATHYRETSASFMAAISDTPPHNLLKNVYEEIYFLDQSIQKILDLLLKTEALRVT